MERKEYRFLTELTERYPKLLPVKEDIRKAYEILLSSYESGGKLMIAGNGGSCADSEHIVGELMKGFISRRPFDAETKEKLRAADPGFGLGDGLAENLQQGLPAIALTGHNALTTAYANDVEAKYAFAQQLAGFGRPGDVFLGITTSGNSANVLAAAVAARALDIHVIGLLGRDGGKMKQIADAAIVVPETETFKIQELHLPVYHALCLMLEDHFFG